MRGRFGLLLVVVLLGVMACGSQSVDITGAAGEPVASGAAPSPVTADQEDQAVPCPQELASSTGAGLACLGLGPNIDLAELVGVVVVPVWASWCEPCRAELPILQEYAQNQGEVVAVAAADNSGAAAALVSELNLSFPSVQDPDSTTRASLGWSALPATFVLQDGEVVGRISGEITSVAQIRQAVVEATKG
ncbi:MAG: TlpA family protein disulfide reductase [Actinomycetia bacterium]|nr:TlpA family protein disulfide reductase [Actinomycetes bacterium]